MTLESSREIEGGEDSKAYVVMQVMYKNEEADFVDAKGATDDSIIDKKDISTVQSAYLGDEVKGRLVFRIPNARTLTSFSGSSKSKLVPRVVVSCNGSETESEAIEGTDPNWDFTGKLKVSAKRKDEFDVTISVYTQNNFLGHMVIPFWKLVKQPESWLFNGYYDIYERRDKLSKGENTTSLGLIYVQMKWSPEDYPLTKTFPPYVTKFN